MAYRVEISPSAIADIEGIFLWIRENSPEKAYRWVRGCYEIMFTLENFPCIFIVFVMVLNRDFKI